MAPSSFSALSTRRSAKARTGAFVAVAQERDPPASFIETGVAVSVSFSPHGHRRAPAMSGGTPRGTPARSIASAIAAGEATVTKNDS